MILKEVVEAILKALVDCPDQVVVREVTGGQCLLYELHVAKSDIAKIVGKHGRTIHALETIVVSAAAKLGKRGLVEIIESDAASPGEPTARANRF